MGGGLGLDKQTGIPAYSREFLLRMQTKGRRLVWQPRSSKPPTAAPHGDSNRSPDQTRIIFELLPLPTQLQEQWLVWVARFSGQLMLVRPGLIRRAESP